MKKPRNGLHEHDLREHECGCASGQGILSGLLPHAGCIVVILLAAAGATAAAAFVKPLFTSQYFLTIVLGISLLSATALALLHLKRHDGISMRGIARNSNYLLRVYGMTALTNMLFIFFIFPAATNLISAKDGGVPDGAGGGGGTKTIKLKVDLPCSGHAPLVVEELKGLKGVHGVRYSPPDVFVIECEASLAESDILSLGVFKDFRAVIEP